MEFLKRYIWWLISLVIALILVSGYILLIKSPQTFPSDSIVVIDRGSSVSDIAKRLSDANIVRHSTVLSLVLRFSGASSRVKSGAYLFSTPENVFAIASRLSTGDYGLPLTRITIPEGMTVRDISERVADALPLVSTQEFIKEGRQYEGYMFPDTYLFSPDANIKSVIDAMRANFDKKVEPLLSDIQSSGHSMSDIIIMASLIEKEARTEANKRIVAGVLWNRLSINMPLQVDAVFGYIFNRDTYSPSHEDLKVDSPYNTYTNTGLPPGPIANPSIESIKAVLYPTDTKYLYYLTGNDNLMHYATTYAEHQSNQRKYLRQ
jgi:UPF0755 protein